MTPRHPFPLPIWPALALGALLALGPAAPGTAEAPAPDELLRAVVELHAEVPAEARTARTLGTERDGNGVVIDGAGLVLTIGYLILEATSVELTVDGAKVPAAVVGYDQDSGFGLVRAQRPLKVKPVALGSAARLAEQAPVLVAAAGGRDAAQPALVVAKRRFAGYWEYMLDDAIFTAPPIGAFGGAALFGPDGRLAGIGSLVVPDAQREPRLPGNMFVPIDLLKPILADLLADGKPAGAPRPWLGVISQEAHGKIVVVQVTPDGPAEKAGIARGDTIVEVGGRPVDALTDFYERLWALGPAGTAIPLTLLHDGATRQLSVTSMDRRRFLKLDITY